MKDKRVKITENRQISPDFYLLSFEWKKEWGIPEAGHFLELKVDESSSPLLRRPLAFSDYNETLEIGSLIYQKRGVSTDLLSKKPVGSEVTIIAPIGTAFGVTGDSKKIIAVGGGVGLGPILFASLQEQTKGNSVSFVTGFRNEELVPDSSLWKNLDATLCTDDGSVGFAGNVVQYLETLSDADLADAVIWACGPTPMLKALHNFAQKQGLKCEVSMEEMMACGIGACTGCVVETTAGGYLRVCKEGPVFDSEVLKWN